MARAVARSVRAAALPLWVLPQLTQLVDAAPDGDQWLHEIKYDGYRMHARLDRGAVKLLTRTGLDWTHKYPAIAKAVAALDARQAYFDGELCGVGPDGITAFNIVQLASDSGNAAALIFFLFDLLHLDGEELRERPLIERKEQNSVLGSAAKFNRSCKFSRSMSILHTRFTSAFGSLERRCIAGPKFYSVHLST
jgi:ATP-dependent DNA ligase